MGQSKDARRTPEMAQQICERTASAAVVIETFRDGNPVAVYRRFRDQGRLMPEGMEYSASWVTADLSRCFQVVECQGIHLLDQWMQTGAT